MAYFCNTLLCHYHTAQCRKSYQSQHNNINYCPFIWSCSSVSLYHPVLLLTTSLVLLARASSSSTSSWTHLQTNRNFTRKKHHHQSVLFVQRTRHLKSSLRQIFSQFSRSQLASKALASHLHINITVLYGGVIIEKLLSQGLHIACRIPSSKYIPQPFL